MIFKKKQLVSNVFYTFFKKKYMTGPRYEVMLPYDVSFTLFSVFRYAIQLYLSQPWGELRHKVLHPAYILKKEET